MSEVETSISSRLDFIGQSVAKIYEPVLEHLQQVRILARRFESGAAALTAYGTMSTGESSLGRGTSVEHAASELRDAILVAEAAVMNPQLDDYFVRMEVDCAGLSLCGKELDSLSFLMLVTAASASSSEFSVDHLVQELRSMSDSLRSAGARIYTTVQNMSNVRQDAGRALKKASDLIDEKIGRVNPDPVEHMGAKQGSRVAKSVEHMAKRLSTQISRLMPGIVACMQYPDAFAQRCDHIARAAELLESDAAAAATKAAIGSLVGAQAGDMRLELKTVQGDALNTLDLIAEQSRSTALDFQKFLSEDQSIRQITDKQAEIQQTGVALKTIRNVAEQALTDLLACIEMSKEIRTTFAQLENMRKAVHMSSMNADLSERRSKVNEPALRTVTKAIGECANNCGDVMIALDASYCKVNQIFSKVEDSRIVNAMDVLDEKLDYSSKQMKHLSSQVAGLRNSTSECVQTLEDIDNQSMAAHSRIKANRIVFNHLENIEIKATDKNSLSPPSGDFDQETLSGIFKNYSIEREREVHRSIFPEATTVSETKNEQHDDGGEEDPFAGFLF